RRHTARLPQDRRPLRRGHRLAAPSNRHGRPRCLTNFSMGCLFSPATISPIASRVNKAAAATKIKKPVPKTAALFPTVTWPIGALAAPAGAFVGGVLAFSVARLINGCAPSNTAFGVMSVTFAERAA